MAWAGSHEHSAARARALLSALAAALALGACGSASGTGESAAARSARLARERAETAPQPLSACPNTVMHTFAEIAKHVYGEGVSSERTKVATQLIGRSLALRQAVERDEPAAVQSVARSLIATGRITNLRVLRGAGGGEAASEVLADEGGGAVAPLRGTIRGASGAVIARYVTSVWSDEGILAETNGIAQSYTVLRSGDRTFAGSLPLPPGPLPPKGILSVAGVRYRYSSIAAQRYPTGSLRIYLVRAQRSFAQFCGATARQTLVRTLESVARAVYAGESGPRATVQVRRVQADPALARAVLARNREATRLAIDNLLTEHIVRLRVSVQGRLLSDVGGPYVLAPVSGTLRSGGRAIASFVLSIQDDEGYLRLARRLGGLYVLMYMGDTLVKNSLGPNPGAVPARGPYTYRGRRFETFTLQASAFPSGPLHIRVLVPIPYS
jgi:hypothetical protein